MGSGCILENNGDNASREPDRESASVTAVAGASLTGSVASSYLGPIKAKNNRLEVGVDVHPRKKFSFSSERLSETVSLSERSATVSFSEEAERNSVAASTRALAGSLLAYRVRIKILKIPNGLYFSSSLATFFSWGILFTLAP